MVDNEALEGAVAAALDCLGGEYLTRALEAIAAGAGVDTPKGCLALYPIFRDHADSLARVERTLRHTADLLQATAIAQLVAAEQARAESTDVRVVQSAPGDPSLN